MSKQQRNLFEHDPDPWDLDEADDRAVAAVVFSQTPFGPYDYLVPDTLRDEVEPGRRVRVPLGRGNRAVVGYCVHLHDASSGSPPKTSRRLKAIKAVLDSAALLPPSMLRLTEWMAEHYLCPWGQVLEAVIPAGVKTQAGTRERTFLSVPTSVAAKLTQIKLPKKQAEALRTLAASPDPLTIAELAQRTRCTTHPVRELQRKGLVRSDSRRVPVGGLSDLDVPRETGPELNVDQQAALVAIRDSLHSAQYASLLIHGITGSGKTEVYIRAIQEVVSFGRQAIVLVPEISLTPQTVARFRSRFDRVAVLHSHLSAVERHHHWRQIASGKVQVVVGARSAVFAPTPQLGLLVLDEEHDASFKQDTNPRYHARDVALQRAQMLRIPVVLGSATPSLESWQRARGDDYRLVELPRRIFDRPLPDVRIVDLRSEYRDRRSRGAISRPMFQAMKETLREGGQVILLLNRRGFSTSIQCPSCGLVVRCPDCEISLTHHRAGEKAICHYCDYKIDAPPRCPDCGYDGIRYAGLGTQRLEAEVRRRFPEATCLRMDSDSMQKPGSHERAFSQFRAGDVDILLGTQMIAKGLDFPNVTLVGVVNADTALHFPDFRAAERTFQLVTQVAGRTGRGERGGRVLVQTFSPDHPAILAASRHHYTMFADQELPVRQEYGYPPYAAMIRLVTRGPSESTTEDFAEQMASCVRREVESRGLETRILGPAPAPIAKLRGKFRYHVLLLDRSGTQLREAVRSATTDLHAPDDTQWIVDVDPLDML
ncbi:MAG: primosomal protein N' [Pirellulaceae bacterium]